MKIKENFVGKGYKIGFVVAILTFGALFGKEALEKKPHLFGWYQRAPENLTEQIVALDKKAAQKYKTDLKNIRACIVPHAGLQYSGVVAASCFRLVNPKNIARIIILAPSHKIPFSGIALPYYDLYQIPNGVFKVDTKAVKVLSKSKLCKVQKFLKDPHDGEHSLEIQLPLLKYYFPDSHIVPLIVGQMTENDIAQGAQFLKKIIDDTTLVVVSSDFTHYGPRFDYEPFKNQDYVQDRIRQLDSSILEPIFDLSCKEFLSCIHKKEATVCGKYPIALLLKLYEQKALGTTQPYLISYTTSQEYDDSDPSHSVSYAGICLAQQEDPHLPYLTNYEKTELLQLARKAIEQHFFASKDEELLYPLETNTLKKTYGAFVTLYNKNGSLRGCIGSINTDLPLYKTIIQQALSAAFYDGRFKPLTQKELPSTQVSISVLSKPTSVASYKDIVLGRDGIILKQGVRQAVFLPAVPGEQGWNLQQTLEHLCLKAGLKKNAWKDKKTDFKVFESVDFREEK